jgi:hypothetical protein
MDYGSTIAAEDSSSATNPMRSATSGYEEKLILHSFSEEDNAPLSSMNSSASSNNDSQPDFFDQFHEIDKPRASGGKASAIASHGSYETHGSHETHGGRGDDYSITPLSKSVTISRRARCMELVLQENFGVAIYDKFRPDKEGSKNMIRPAWIDSFYSLPNWRNKKRLQIKYK